MKERMCKMQWWGNPSSQCLWRDGTANATTARHCSVQERHCHAFKSYDPQKTKGYLGLGEHAICTKPQ